jgi:hypothetical protein
MAFPTILFNTTTGGSDTAASGAGPATALTGTNASYSGAVVTLDGSPDLSGVATDGSHVLYLVTSAGVKFFKITAVDNGADTVTVTPSPTGTTTGRTWAIGGKRSSMASATSKLLVDNGGSAGDAKAGWTLQMESGYTETIGATFDLRVTGDTTDGPLTIQAAPGAATRPVLTFTNNGNAILFRGTYQVLRGFKMVNSNATKTLSLAVGSGSGTTPSHIDNMIIGDVTNKFWRGISIGTVGPAATIRRSLITSCASYGFHAGIGFILEDSRITGCGDHGIFCDSGTGGNRRIVRCLIDGNTGDGYHNESTTSTNQQNTIDSNIFYNNGGDGIEFNQAVSSGHFGSLSILRNMFILNGGYGHNLTNLTAAGQAAWGLRIDWNAYYSNTSGTHNGGSLGDNEITLSANPFEDAGADDFNLNNTAGGGADLRDLSETERVAESFPYREWVADSFGGGEASLIYVRGANALLRM